MPDRPPPRAAVQAAMKLRRTLLTLADRAMPPQWAMFDKTIGVARTQVLGTLAELDVADLLAERPQTAAELAPQLQVHAETLHRVLRAAAVEGFVKLDRSGRFKLTRLGATLRRDHPHSVRDWSIYMASKATTMAWTDLSESVRTGDSAFPRVHGMSVWEWFAAHPEEERRFAGGMRWITEELAPMVVGGYEWPQNAVVCDIAGGVGTLLAAILKARGDLRGVLVDGPGVLSEADAWLQSQGLRERVELVAGDIFERVDARADVYLLKDVLHDWDDAACAKILATVRATMSAGSRMVLVEDLQEQNEVSPTASLTDLQMLTQCDGGRQRSEAELKSLLQGAGLRPGATAITAGPALIEAFA